MPPTRSRAVLAWLLQLLGWCALVVVACPALLTSGAVDQPDEYLEFHAATLAFFADGLELGRLYWWNPYKHGGGSVFGDPTTLAPFYPLMGILRWTPLDLLLPLAMVLHLALGAMGLQRLARALGAGRAGATAAGVTGLLASWSVVPLVDGQLDVVAIVAWTPWTLLALLAALRALQAARGSPERARAPGYVVAAALCLALVGLGCHARFAAVTFAAVGLTGVCLWLMPPEGHRPRPLGWALALGGTLLLGGLLSAPAVVPAAAEVALSRAGPPGDLSSLSGQVLPLHGMPGLVYPKALVLDERWHHVGVGLLLCLATLSDRRGRWLLAAGGLLMLLAMGSSGPLFFVVRPAYWLLYPVESSVGWLGLPLLAVAVGLAVDRLAADGAQTSPSRAWPLVAAVGLAAMLLGWWADRRVYQPSIRSVQPLADAALVHGAVAVVALTTLLALGRRLGARRLGAALLALLLVDGLIYSWRVHGAMEGPRVRPSEFVASPGILDGIARPKPAGRVLEWPLQRVRGIPACLDATRATGHGWYHADWIDPLVLVPREAREVVDAALPRNAGARSGLPQVGGRAKIPPMPWSALVNWMSARDPGPDGEDEVGDDAAGPLVRRGPPIPVTAPTPWGPLDELIARRLPPRCEDGPLMGEAPPQRWIPRAFEVLHVHHVVSVEPLEALPGTRAVSADVGARVVSADVLGRAVPSDMGARLEVVDPRPPALLSPGVREAADLKDAERLVFGTDLDLRERAVVVAPAPSLPGGAPAASAARVLEWSPGRWTVELPPGGGLLTVAERHHPGWRAMDGQGARLETVAANLVMLAVVVPEGVERVTLRFEPPGLGRGLTLGAVGLLLLLGLVLFGPRRRM